GVRSIGELEYACRENRLLSLKGFGGKMQKKVLDSIEFIKTTQGRRHWVDAQKIYKEILDALKNVVGQENKIEGVGAFRRRAEVIENLDFLIEMRPGEDELKLKQKVQKSVTK